MRRVNKSNMTEKKVTNLEVGGGGKAAAKEVI